MQQSIDSYTVWVGLPPSPQSTKDVPQGVRIHFFCFIRWNSNSCAMIISGSVFQQPSLNIAAWLPRSLTNISDDTLLEHCHLTYMTLLTLTYSRNDLKLFCLIMRNDLLLLLYGASGRFVERRLTNLSLYCIVFVLTSNELRMSVTIKFIALNPRSRSAVLQRVVCQGRRHGFESGGGQFFPPLFGQWGDKILLR